jgi:hypothetical protein
LDYSGITFSIFSLADLHGDDTVFMRRTEIMKNREVASAWWNGRSATTKHLKTDGRSLWSYNLMIATVKDGNRVVYDYTSKGGNFQSVTTSKHVGLAARHGNLIAPG